MPQTILVVGHLHVPSMHALPSLQAMPQSPQFLSSVCGSTHEPPHVFLGALQGTGVSAAGLVFGQGVRCVAGTLRRLYVKAAVGGSITAPSGADPSVSMRSAALGDPIAPGSSRYYGVYYRDPIVLGGCPGASTFNITSQLAAYWSP